MRHVFQWKIARRGLQLGRRTLVMGILNVTPDSFSDGGLAFAPERAIARALSMLDLGADIIDIGGESTRPGAKVSAPSASTVGAPFEGVSLEEELRRVLPVLSGILRERPQAILSIDTYKSEVARQAVAAGAAIVNDVSGLTWDPSMAATVATSGAGLVLMHMRGRPEQWRSLPRDPNIVETVERELRERSDEALAAGIPREAIVLDPGFGFGKNFEENFPLLAHFDHFAKLGYPLLAATSRKSFLARAVSTRLNEISSREAKDAPPSERLTPTIASLAVAILKGAHILRVHDVDEAIQAAAVVDAVETID